MLSTLRVKNLALVEDTRVQFAAGLNMITGETGAGKSILIGALGLLLGERADKSLIRTGADSCSAEAVFLLNDPEAVGDVLEALGLDPLEDGQCIIRRVVKTGGTGQAWLNDQPVTLNALKQLGECLVDMHGPYDHQSLLHADAQRDLLDAFGHCFKTRDAYEKQYALLRDLDRRREECGADGENVTAQIELLTYKINELEDAKLSVNEEDEVAQEHAVFGHAQRIVELGNTAANGLTEGDGAAADVLAGVLRALEELAKLLPEAEAWSTDIEEASTRIRDVAADLALRMERMDADPARLDWLDQRLTIYQKMKRKYGPTVQDALDQLAEARQRLEALQQRDETLAQLEAERERRMAELLEVGRALHAERKKAAEQLAKAITAELRELGFTHGRFGVECIAGPPQPNGIDVVEFMFEPNLGEGMRPLRQIASSGEIARVMLATKAILARHDRIPVLVFDEIDANIGGEIGGAVGRKLADVARHHQILCITHLPQVAMYGSTHFAVRKEERGDRTHTDVVRLEDEDRVEEIARMLGGRSLTELTLTHAREMLNKAGAGASR